MPTLIWRISCFLAELFCEYLKARLLQDDMVSLDPAEHFRVISFINIRETLQKLTMFSESDWIALKKTDWNDLEKFMSKLDSVTCNNYGYSLYLILQEAIKKNNYFKIMFLLHHHKTECYPRLATTTQFTPPVIRALLQESKNPTLLHSSIFSTENTGSSSSENNKRKRKKISSHKNLTQNNHKKLKEESSTEENSQPKLSKLTPRAS